MGKAKEDTMVSQPAERSARRVVASIAVTLVAMTLVAVTLLVVAASASAGVWTLMSCRQPNGQPAPTDGWTAGAIGSPGFFTEGVNSCSQPGGSLVAVSSGRWVQPASSGYQWRFAAPKGSTIAGGQLDVDLSAPHGFAAVLTAEQNYDPVYQVTVCGLSETCGITGPSTWVAINHTGVSGLYASAICFPFGPGCGEASGVDAQVTIYAAQIALESSVSPSGSGFGGGLLVPGASGVQQFLFTAAVPGGPGIWQVSATVDGQTVYDETPDTNSGKCQSVGAGPGGGAEFLYEQPCKQSEAVSIPVDTSQFATGAHELTVKVTDAAGNTATVFNGTINTFNAASQTPWSVSLGVSPRQVHLHSWIKLLGRVTTSPRPPRGKLIDLEAREVTVISRGRGRHRRVKTIGGAWVTFKVLRTKPEGVFKARYRFRFGGRHRYQFRAVAPQEGDFDADTGTSAIVGVSEN
jgi:hypothetical protein